MFSLSSANRQNSQYNIYKSKLSLLNRTVHISKIQINYVFLLNVFLLLIIQVPGEPQDFKIIKVTSNTIELEWKAPRREEQSTSSNIKGYEIHYFKVNPSSPSSSSSSSSSNDPKQNQAETQIFKRKTNDVKKLKYTLTDLDPNSLYKIQIFAYNVKGDGQRSNPLLVNTLDEGPNKPENIRSEIHNDLLQIKWHAPSQTPSSEPALGSWVVSAKNKQQVGGYRLYFNNEKYEVDALTNQITFQRPKWGMFLFLCLLKFLN